MQLLVFFGDALGAGDDRLDRLLAAVGLLEGQVFLEQRDHCLLLQADREGALEQVPGLVHVARFDLLVHVNRPEVHST